MTYPDEFTETGNINESGNMEPQNPTSSSSPPLVEAGLACLVTAARIAGIPADLEGILRAFPSRRTEEIILVLLRAAKKLGLKAKHITTSIDRLDKLPSPSLLLFPDGETVICLRAENAPPEHESDEESVKKAALDGRVVLFHPRGKKPFI
jgi:subfamily B ATP-binding cassette protein HlyB/CyaB